jgi:hypothetical protein
MGKRGFGGADKILDNITANKFSELPFSQCQKSIVLNTSSEFNE